MIDRNRLESLLTRERAQFIDLHPRSQQAFTHLAVMRNAVAELLA